VAAARGAVQQADARVREVQARLELSRKRVEENRELVKTGAGDRFALEAAEADAKALEAQLDTARGVLAQSRGTETQAMASERQVRQRQGGKVGTDYAQVAQVKAQLDNARWQLEQTTVLAPADGYAINVQLRPGSFTAAFPITPAMTFVENAFQVIALYHQNELHQIEPGNEAEFILNTHPGHVFKAKVDSIVWAQGQGQVANTTQLPMTGYGPVAPGRFPVKLLVDAREADVFMPAGAIGDGAIYTDHLAFLHILRKVLLRVSTKTNYLVLKLH
jgi:multidrug resistance efflux pump